MIRLTVPGTLSYRDLVLRVVESSCSVLHPSASAPDSGIVDKVVSAVSEAFNNIAIHAYAEHSGDVDIEIFADEHTLTIRMSDMGRSFEPDTVTEPDLSSLPERQMGLYIIRSFMDTVAYVRGSADQPNVLTLGKRFG
jgi:anti-sigma regulatory factor (Ser/Thr protein kinase)